MGDFQNYTYFSISDEKIKHFIKKFHQIAKKNHYFTEKLQTKKRLCTEQQKKVCRKKKINKCFLALLSSEVLWLDRDATRVVLQWWWCCERRVAAQIL